MTDDRPLLGIALMLGFCTLAPLGDSFAKLLGQTISVGQLVTVRFIIQVVILLPVVWFSGRNLRMSRRLFILTAARTVLHIAGIGAMFLALRYMPLADTIAIAFVMPFIMLLLGRTILNEQVGPHRLLACAVGFIGTLMVIQPNFISIGPAALLPVFVAVVFAFFMLITRKIAKDCDPISLQTVSGIMASIVLIPALLIGSQLNLAGFAVITPAPSELALLLGLGVLGTVAHLLMTWSLRFAPSATLAPMQYLEIPVATVIGWLIFNDLPNGWAAIGIAVTIGSGLYVIYRERVMALMTASKAP